MPSSPSSFSRLTLMGRDSAGIEKTIAALGILALLSMLQAILAVVLLVRLDFKQDDFLNISNNVIEFDQYLYNNMLDSGMVLASFCIILNFCCIVVCTIQSYFAAKMMKLPQGEERAYKFLSSTSGTRFIVISAFFASIPVFLAVLCLYLLIEFRFVPAIISTTFIGLGIIFTIFCFGRSVHLWRTEQDRVAQGLNAYEPATPGGSIFPVMSGDLFGHHHVDDHQSHTPNGHMNVLLANGHMNGNNNGYINDHKPTGHTDGHKTNGHINGHTTNGHLNGHTKSHINGLIKGYANGSPSNHKYIDEKPPTVVYHVEDKSPVFFASRIGSNGDSPHNNSNLSTLV